MIHQIRIALAALIIAVSLILLITYYYVRENNENDLYALGPVYQFTRDCEEEYFTVTGRKLDDHAKTQLLSLAYKVLYRGEQKHMLNTPKKPFNPFAPQLNEESQEAMNQTSRLLYSEQLKSFCKPFCPEFANKINFNDK